MKLAIPQGTMKLITALFATMTISAQAEEVSYTVSQSLTDIDFNSTYSRAMEVNRFDDMGGTRELLGMRVSYFIGNDYTVQVDDNLTPDFVASDTRWASSWVATNSQGDRVFANGEGSSVQANMGHGYFLGGFVQGFESTVTGGGFGFSEIISDQAILDSFTGVDPMLLNGAFEISDLTYLEIDLPGKDFVFAPELLTITLDALNLDVTVTYTYATVPAPGALSLLAMGMLPIASRRRRN
jgi:hypothetical protein